jgi:hypothetical protein
MNKEKNIEVDKDFIKAARRGSREAEIELYGHPISFQRVFKNKKKYTRKIKHRNCEK